jgi:hypothetical protein
VHGVPSKGARRVVHTDAENLAEEVLYRAECHITAARFYSNVHLFVGMATAALAAAAGGTAFAGQTVVAGIAGIAAAALAVFLTVFKPDERTQSHGQAARDHRDLVDRIDLFFRLGWTRALDDDLKAGAITPESGESRPPLAPEVGEDVEGNGRDDGVHALARFRQKAADFERNTFPVPRRLCAKAEGFRALHDEWYPPHDAKRFAAWEKRRWQEHTHWWRFWRRRDGDAAAFF